MATTLATMSFSICSRTPASCSALAKSFDSVGLDSILPSSSTMETLCTDRPGTAPATTPLIPSTLALDSTAPFFSETTTLALALSRASSK